MGCSSSQPPEPLAVFRPRPDPKKQAAEIPPKCGCLHPASCTAVLSPSLAMADWDIDKLASEVKHVRAVGLGRPLRAGAEADQLLALAESLVPDSTLLPFRLYEEALRPSIERLGQGRLGRIAQIEFGISPDALNLHTLKKRRDLAAADQELDPERDRFKTLEKEMYRALAEDLLARAERYV